MDVENLLLVGGRDVILEIDRQIGPIPTCASGLRNQSGFGESPQRKKALQEVGRIGR
ncbi:hypothetical protein [Sphingomicrobium nitratireducens]|uniref:hypothetical protein n=1 Tax=Sphingomicrobium nitratireducens TaxID=2964666 RepID=UPI0022408137|nr:hypothetical protein [Sphingomicrobium nitratireducens]